MNKDQVKGRMKKIEGEAIDQRGDATGSVADDIKGKVEKGIGHVQKEYGDAKERVRRDLNDDDLDRT